MKIVKDLDFYEFRDLFSGSQYENNFSYEEMKLLFDEMESLAECYEGNINPYGDDIVAICCDYSGYCREDFIMTFREEINDRLIDEEDEEEILEKIIDYIDYHSRVTYDNNKQNFLVLNF